MNCVTHLVFLWNCFNSFLEYIYIVSCMLPCDLVADSKDTLTLGFITKLKSVIYILLCVRYLLSEIIISAFSFAGLSSNDFL